MTIRSLEIPNVDNNPYVIQPYVMNDSTYEFAFKWNNRAEFCTIDIYSINDGTREKIISNLALINEVNLTKIVHNDLWNYNLALIDITGKSRRPKQSNISTEYLLIFEEK